MQHAELRRMRQKMLQFRLKFPATFFIFPTKQFPHNHN